MMFVERLYILIRNCAIALTMFRNLRTWHFFRPVFHSRSVAAAAVRCFVSLVLDSCGAFALFVIVQLCSFVRDVTFFNDKDFGVRKLNVNALLLETRQLLAALSRLCTLSHRTFERGLTGWTMLVRQMKV